ncbi:MAG: tripeptide aminopeptidase PepT [Spirochaetaceae bacterium]|nr:tripeptide aminopeptidase PepT [Spirochaetaceae bacterium]
MLQEKILNRFLRYVKICTESCKKNGQTPTTEGQWELANVLYEELSRLGITDLTLTKNCYLIARIPSNTVKPSGVIGFMAHLDTAEGVSGKNVKPVVKKNADGKTIIESGGGTLLGADDKAGIAIIVSAAEYIINHPEIEHCALELIFTPDEETGKGLPCFPAEEIHSSICYTVDGGPEPELEIECFNAYSVAVAFTGKPVHPGYARGILINAALMAAVYASMLPRNESPEATDGRYGYYGVTEISGTEDAAVVNLILRDFSKEGVERRLAALKSFAAAVEAQFPGGKASVEAKLTYRNMREKIEENPKAIDNLKQAAKRIGVPFNLKPIRGGTDGARLAELGVPAPNIWTGGRNFHSREEWVALDEMETACRLVIELTAFCG